MPKKKKKPEELTQFQLDRRVYNAFADQAWNRAYFEKSGVQMPWEDPTRDWRDDEEE